MAKFENMDEIIKKRIAERADIVIEGAIGRGWIPRGFYLFSKFRENGYEGTYLGIDKEERPSRLPLGLLYFENAGCLDTELIKPILEMNELTFPVFVTNDRENVFFNSRSRIDKVLEVTCRQIGYQLQLHKQYGNFSRRSRSHFIKTAKEKYGFKAAKTPKDLILIERKK